MYFFKHWFEESSVGALEDHLGVKIIDVSYLVITKEFYDVW